MTDFDGDSNVFMIFIKHTPNMKNLTIYNYKHSNMIDASCWKQLITFSLPYLDTFKFKFATDCRNEDNNILDKFQRFLDLRTSLVY
jgi:hypothetical protein